MKKLLFLLASAGMLASCSSAIAPSESAKRLREAQALTSEKGTVTFDIDKAGLDLVRTIGGKDRAKIKVQNIGGDVTFRSLPRSLSEFGLDYLKNMGVSADLHAAFLDVKAYQQESYATVFTVTNPELKVALDRNVGYADFSGVTFSGGTVNGNPITDLANKFFKVSPLFLDTPIGFNFDESTFNAFVMTLAKYRSQGGVDRAEISLKYDSLSDLYTGIMLAKWMADNGYDASAALNKSDEAVVRMRNLYREQIGEVLSKDFKFDLALGYTDKGIRSFELSVKGTFATNVLDVDDDRDVERISVDLDLNLRIREEAKVFTIPTGDYIDVRH